MNFFTELKRRNVFRVAAAYIVASWLVIEVSSVVLPVFGAPDWVLKLIMVFITVGLVIALMLSWLFEVTPDGIKLEAEVDRTHSITSETAKKLDRMTIALIVVGLVVLGIDRMIPEQTVPTLVPETTLPADEPENSASPVAVSAQSAPNEKSIAVLPFVNMSSDPEQEYFSDGISEELLNVLVKIKGLRVPSRTSSFAFKGKQESIRDIAAALGVDHILEGSVRKSGEQIRVTAQLIDVRDDAHLWSETYTRKLDDIFVIQDEIAAAIVAALKVALGTGEIVGNYDTDNTVAYNHYLRGRFFWQQRTEAGFVSGEQDLRKAVELDPGFARAWAGLADLYLLQPEYGWATSHEAIPKARETAERALSLDPNSSQAHTTRAYYLYLYEWDWVGAEQEFLLAIELDPDYATAYQWYGEMLAVQRRFDESIRQVRIALSLEPTSPIHSFVLARTLVWAGRQEEALEWANNGVQLAPDWPQPLYLFALVELEQKRFDAASDFFLDFLRKNHEDLTSADHIVAALDALAGERPVAEAIELLLKSQEDTCNELSSSAMLARLGAHDAAVAALNRCRKQGDPFSSFINVISAYQPMREMPEFQAMLAEMNLLDQEPPDMNTHKE